MTFDVHGLLNELKASIDLGKCEELVTLLYRIPHSLNDVINKEFFDELITVVKNLEPGILQVKLLAMLQERADEKKKLEIRHLLMQKILSLSQKIAASASHMTRSVVTRYRLGLDEIDVERTLEEQVGEKNLDAEHIYCHEKVKQKNAYVLMLDVSNSMHQEKIAVGAIATGVFASKLKNDFHGVLTFANSVTLIKHVNVPGSLEGLVDRMLDIKSGGATNIRNALLHGLTLLKEAKTAYRSGILVTDGWATVGGDPVEVAAKYDKLHVLGISFGLGGSDPQTNRLMAKKGHGRSMYVDSFEDLPLAITKILANR